MSEYKKLAQALSSMKKEENLLAKTDKLLSAPQKYTMKKIADALGVDGDSDNSEKSAQAIVEKGAEVLGLPDSAATNALKAAGVAGLEVFADPTNLVPLGRVAKFGGKVAEKFLPAGIESLRKLEGAILQGKVKVSPEVAAKLSASLKEARPKNIVEALPEKYEKIGSHFAKKEPTNFGKVIKVGEAKEYDDVANMLDTRFAQELKRRQK